MFNILLTVDVLTDEHYYSKCIGSVAIKPDPAEKFKSIKLEDDTDSVRTTLFRSFGTKLDMNTFWNSLDEKVKAVPVETEIQTIKELKPEVELIQQIKESEEPIDLPEPEPLEKPKTSKKK
jgi:hypothetical protein